MLRPTPEQLAVLEPFERFAFTLCDQFNRRPLLKRAAHTYLRTFGAGWVTECTKNIRHLAGLGNLPQAPTPGGIVIASNHRSFFDLYVITSVMLREMPWIRGMYFPVRSTYFYERPDGIAVNAVMSALAMYPPVVRDGPRRVFNQYAVDLLVELAQVPGNVIGYHPEGTRNKTPDPYTLLRAQPGIGQLAYHARPTVLPVFILGVCNDIVRQVRGNFDGTGEPITIVFGEPLDLSEFYERRAKITTYKAIADRVNERITELGEEERALRRRLGLLSLDAPTAA